MIGREEVLRVAQLAKLELAGGDLDRFAEQFGRILEYMELLGDLDEDDAPVPPTPETRLRPDEPGPGLTREQALAFAPKSDGEHFLVPPVLGEGNK